MQPNYYNVFAYFYEKFERCKANSKRTWSNVNEILGRKRRDPIRKVITDGGRMVEGQTMVDCFNSYFTSVVSRITESLPRDINFDYLRTLDPIQNSCFSLPTDEIEVLTLL